jgi:methionine-rich copper-binding protein CopC
MQRFFKLSIAVVLASAFAANAALAHAFLDRAVPSVGGTVSGSPREIRLYFTQGVVTAFSHVHVVSEAGAVVPAGRLINDPSNQQIVIVHLGHALTPGTYSVSWQVVSVDTHTTQGTFSFTLS